MEKTIDGVTFIEFDIFKDLKWLNACFSTRIGGVSEGFLESMNLVFKKDTDENVRENYRRLCSAVGLSYDGITFSSQEHGINIRKINIDDKGKGFHKHKDYNSVDGIITDEPGIALTTFYADCVPVFIADPVNNAIGLAHAGWRGTVNGIATAALSEMNRAFGTSPENIVAAIGPSICFSCFEVDKPVAEEFLSKLPFSKDFIISKDSPPDKFIIDLKNINKRLLMDSGVKEDNIEISDYCTKCNGKLFFSHRRSGLERGSMAALMEVGYPA